MTFARSGDSIILHHHLLPLNKNIKIILNYIIGPLVFCLLAWSIWQQLYRQPHWPTSLQQVKSAFAGNAWWKIALVGVLMIVNWSLEARKWQILVNRVQRISFWQSVKAVFTGTTMAFFTPNRMGEYMGRILYIEDGKRIKAISLTLVGSMAQLLVTWLAGIGGFLFVRCHIADNSPADTSMLFWTLMMLYITIAGFVILTLFYFRIAWLVRWIERIPRIDKFVTYIKDLDSLNATILLRILSLSIARYGIFIAQYYLLFEVFGVSMHMGQVAGAISVVFLLLSIVPTIAIITELGVRWKASIEVVQLFSGNITGILATSLAIWVINLVIPALIGSLLILGLKIFTNKK
jgi:hypothetical protein